MNRELKAVLEVYTRKIRTFIDTQISRINTNLRVAYEHLVSRTSKYPVNYDIADRTIWDSEHLLTAITAFSARKISIGSAPNDGIPDGTSLAHLLCSTDVAKTVTELKDDNYGWVLNKPITASQFANLVKLKIGCKEAHLSSSQYAIVENIPTLQSLELPELEVVTGNQSSYGLVYGANQVSYLSAPKLKYAGGVFALGLIYNCQLDELYLPEFIGFTYTYRTQLLTNCPTIKKINCPKFQQNVYGSILENCPNIEEIYVPSTENIASVSYEGNMLKDLVHLRVFVAKALRQNGNPESFEGCTNLIHIEVGDGIAENIALNAWSPTNALDASRTDLIEQGSTAENNLQQFLQNFREHIALRLTANGSGKTLTLSQAVRNAIHAAESTYGIEDIIVTQKGWRIQPDAS